MAKECLLVLFLPLFAGSIVVGGTCTKGAIRYDPQYNNTVIQICMANRWGYICANEGNAERIAQVACQQMGYSNHNNTGINPWINHKRIAPYPTPLFLYWIQCLYKPIVQQNILDCSYIAHELGYHQQTCEKKPNYAVASNCTNTSICQNGRVKLDSNAVMLCKDGKWYALCSKKWSRSQAQVVCRQLGKNPRSAKPLNVSLNTSASASAELLDAHFHCIGDESFLYNCSDSFVHDCSSGSLSALYIVAGVTCEELPSPQNLSINITKSSLTLYWTFNNSIDKHLNFTVYCSTMKVYVQQQSNMKSELTIQTKDNNAMLVGLSLNTTYTCCVSAVLPYMETESTCINITTDEQGNSTENSSTMFAPSFNSAVSWIGGILIGITISAILIVIIILMAKLAIIARKKKEKQSLRSPAAQTPNEHALPNQKPNDYDNGIYFYADLPSSHTDPVAPTVASEYESPVEAIESTKYVRKVNENHGVTIDPYSSIDHDDNDELDAYDKLRRN